MGQCEARRFHGRGGKNPPGGAFSLRPARRCDRRATSRVAFHARQRWDCARPPTNCAFHSLTPREARTPPRSARRRLCRLFCFFFSRFSSPFSTASASPDLDVGVGDRTVAAGANGREQRIAVDRLPRSHDVVQLGRFARVRHDFVQLPPLGDLVERRLDGLLCLGDVSRRDGDDCVGSAAFSRSDRAGLSHDRTVR